MMEQLALFLRVSSYRVRLARLVISAIVPCAQPAKQHFPNPRTDDNTGRPPDIEGHDHQRDHYQLSACWRVQSESGSGDGLT